MNFRVLFWGLLFWGLLFWALFNERAHCYSTVLEQWRQYHQDERHRWQRQNAQIMRLNTIELLAHPAAKETSVLTLALLVWDRAWGGHGMGEQDWRRHLRQEHDDICAVPKVSCLKYWGQTLLGILCYTERRCCFFGL